MSKTKARMPSRRPARSSPREPVTVAELIRHTAVRLKRAGLVFAHGTSDPAVEASFIVGETLRIPPDRIEAQSGALVAPAQRDRIAALVEQRIRTRKPAAYLLRCMYMRGFRFYVDARTIVPRSYLGEIVYGDVYDGEGLLWRDADDVRSVLDLCTGSGCLAILAAKRFRRARIDAVDLSKAALAVAARNVRDHRLSGRIRLLQGDLFAPVKSRRYDLIIANPPYVDRAGMAKLPPECRREPRLALDGGADGLAVVRRIVDEAGRHLAEGGGLLCEVGRGRSALERAYPGKAFLWLDTEDSSGEVFWLGADQLRA